MKGIAPTIALVGNPNSGKTTLFNALTAQCAAVGNWAGVTVRQHECHCSLDEQVFKVVDLPGIYTLTYIEEEGSQDEKLTCHYLQENSIQAIINVIDVLKLERHLYLTLQCLEQNRPLIVVLNRLDLLETSLNLSYLSKVLGVPVIGISARESRGLKELKAHLKNLPKTVSAPPNIYPEIVEKQLKQLHEKLPAISRHQWLQWLEGQIVPQALIPLINQARQTIQAHLNEESDIVIAKARYKFIEKTLHELKQEKNNPHFSINLTQKLDNFFCHPFWGVPLFFGVMYLLFFWSIELGGIFQDFFELSANAFIHHSGAQIAHSFSITQSWWDILVQGLAQGVSTVFGFIPVLGMMFFGLAFLEDSGYMARSAFVMDRLMRAIGLPGKSLVPLLIGFGCNVGAVAGMRSLERKRERIVGIMMSPFMSCGARLAIFTVFVSAFFPHQGQGSF